MLLTMLKSKLHSATLTECDLYYEGSIAIDMDLVDAANMLISERVDVWNITNGSRFSTYIIEAPRGSGTIMVNGAAARLCQKGDKVIIATFAQMQEAKAKKHTPTVILLNDKNEPQKKR